MQLTAPVLSARSWRWLKWAAVLGACVMGTRAASASAATVSYDAGANTLPTDPPFRYLDTSRLSGPAAQVSIANHVLTLGPSSTPGYSFWYTDSLFLDHTQSVDIVARLKLDSQSSNSPNTRAGLAIAFTDDRDLYQDLFINAQGVFFDKLDITGTTRVRDTAAPLDATQWHTYDLHLHGNAVSLSVDGVQIISSSLFDVSATGELVLPDFVSLGDITASAQSKFDLKSLSVTVVPEPSLAPFAMLTLAGIIASRRLWVDRSW